ncbi:MULTISPECIES: hypothetical protein [Psychrobacter]|uniref:hypothetical protein n=1 Tax=Psychrobacter TaxID=497 RepID=UPI00191901A9|nr:MULTISPECIES: hypothetical protein [Psychrobacter]
MDTQKSATQSAPSTQAQGTSHHAEPSSPKSPSLVPKGITIGLGVFALILSLAGYGFRLMVGDDVGEVVRHAAVVVPVFMLGIPILFWLGSRVFNKVKNTHIQSWNAISLGYLTSCISLLWLMGTYS